MDATVIRGDRYYVCLIRKLRVEFFDATINSDSATNLQHFVGVRLVRSRHSVGETGVAGNKRSNGQRLPLISIAFEAVFG